MQIVLLEPHTSIRQGIAHVLNAQKDWSVCGEAENSTEAIAFVERYRPRLVLMKIGLSTGDDLQTIRSISQTSPDSRIIGLSVQTDGALVTELRDAGISEIVDQKRVYDDLLPTIHRVLGSEKNI